MTTSTQAQEWIDTNFYPFEAHYLQLDAGRMHYIDEGEGEVILFIHGTPTWSFLYRDFVKSLSQSHRCIAVDHLGFGLSESPESFDGTPRAHSANLAEFIEKMDLKGITLVVHDFGGPIGLGWAVDHPDLVERVVLFNTWLWGNRDNPDAVKVDKMINSWLGRFLYLNLNFSPKVLLKKGFHDKKKLPKNVHRHYLKPFPDKASRRPLYSLAQSLVGSSEWYEDQREKLHRLEAKPWLILWGMHDEFLNEDHLQKWRESLPKAQVMELECGHFVQEEKAEEAIEAIRGFLPKR